MWVAPAGQPEPAWPPATGAPRYDYEHGSERTIRDVLAHLGLEDYPGPIPAPRTRRQSNERNEARVAAYLAETRRG